MEPSHEKKTENVPDSNGNPTRSPSSSKRKRILTLTISALAFFFGGIEYAVVIPTLWPFLATFDATTAYYGLTFAAFSIAALISGPIVGALMDRYRHPKAVFLLAALAEVGGNAIYMTARSRHTVLAARFACGAAFGAIETTLLSHLARATRRRGRTALFAVLLAARQSGLLIGPVFNVGLCRLDFRLGDGVHVNAFTAPGFFMIVVWGCLCVAAVFAFVELPEIAESTEGEVTKKKSHKDADTSSSSTGASIWSKILDCLKEEYVVLFATNFIHYYNQCAFEATIVPLCTRLLKWGEIPVSVVYSVAAAEGLACYVIVRVVSRRVADRWLLVIGLVVQTFGLLWYIIFVPRMEPLDEPRYLSINVFLFLVPGAAIIFGIPFLGVAAVSLISKITRAECQGVVLGLFRAAQKVGLIIGPLWGGALLDSLYVMFGVMLSVQGLVATLLFVSFSRLRERE